MQTKEKEINGVTVTNAEWVIRKYFGEKMYDTVMTNPENFYLVLEPAATAQLPLAKKDMSRDQIYCATTYGWGWILDICQSFGKNWPDEYYK